MVATALAAAAASTVVGASASGSSSFVVRGTDLPAGNRAQLTLVGCGSVFERGAAAHPMIGISTGAGAIGKRSLAFDSTGGSAVGLVGYVESMATTTTAGLSVQSAAGTSGVAYAGYQAPKDAGTDLLWIGRAVLAAPAGSGWSGVEVTGLGYDWTQYDMSTQRPVASVGPSGVPAFVKAMGGDGYGFYAVGFGCDGSTFNLDGWRIGGSGATATYDFEGYRTATTIAGPDAPVEAGGPATLTGRVVDGSGAPVGGRAVLEAKQADGSWETVDVADGPNPKAVVRPQKTTKYRWKFFDRARYEGSVSSVFTVEVADRAEPGEGPAAHPSAPVSAQPSESPSSEGPSKPAGSPADTRSPAADTPAPDPEPQASENPTEDPSAPADKPADPPSDPPSQSPTDPPATDPTAAADAAEAPAG